MTSKVVPDGWKVDPDQIIHTWLDFAEKTVIPHQTTAFLSQSSIIFFPFSIFPLNAFVEIDYGVDENKTEEEVRLRLGNGNIEKGKKIIEDWDKNAVV